MAQIKAKWNMIVWKKAWAFHDPKFSYAVGKTKTVRNYDMDDTTCAEGIHFFVDIQDAKDYVL